MQQYNLGASVTSQTLLHLEAASTYYIQIQAWTAPVGTVLPGDTSTCIDGERYTCSRWSCDQGRCDTTITTAADSPSWYVSPSGSYLTGNGSISNPMPMDLQA